MAQVMSFKLKGIKRYSPTQLLSANLYLENTKIATCNGGETISLIWTKKGTLLQAEITQLINDYTEKCSTNITKKENLDSSPLLQIVKELLTLNEMEQYLMNQRKKYINSVLVLYSFTDKADEVYYYGTWGAELEEKEVNKVAPNSFKVFRELSDFSIK